MLRLAVLLFAGLTCALCASVDECQWGESYWCSSLENAKTCGAFDHCMSTIWKNEILKQDDTEVCQFCQAFIGDVVAFVKSNETEQKILHYLKSACQMIPNTGVAAECEKIADTFVVEIIKMITNDINPRAVCTLLTLCTGFEDKVSRPQLPTAPIAEVPAVPIKTEPICTDCKKFFGDIKNMITSNATEQEVEDFLDQMLCSLLGPYENTCKDLVKAYLPEIMELLSSEFDPNMICQAFGFCDKSVDQFKNLMENLKLKKYETSGVKCDMCKAAMKEFQNLDRNKAVQEALKKFIKNSVCKLLGQYQLACDGAVDIYAETVFEMLANELDPESRCRSFGFCAVEESTPVKAPVSPLPGAVDSSVQCILCEFVMKELDDMLAKNSTKEEIKAAVNKVCSILPGTIKTDCLDFVKTYGDAIIDLLVQQLKPEIICTLLKLCNGHQQLPPVSTNPMTCTICETTVQYIQAILEQNSTITEIEALLHKVCNLLPEKDRPECYSTIDTYGPFIIQYFSVALTPKEICQLVHACPKAQTMLASLLTEAKEVKTVHRRLGENECTWGPKHWCSSRDVAKTCNATAFCEENGWLF